MPVDPALVDTLAARIADLYRDVETALVKAIAQRLDRDLPSPEHELKLDTVRKLQNAAQAILARLQAARTQAVREAIARAYQAGTDAALDEVARIRPGTAQAARQALDQAPNLRLITNIAGAVLRDAGRVDWNILRAPLDIYRAVQAGTAARIASGAFTRREAAQAAWQALIDRGIVSFIDRAGRRWRLSSYVEMIARTNIQRAAIQGQTDRLQALGEDLVIVSDSPRECPKCRPWERKVLSISGRHRGRIRVEHATRDGEYVEVNVAGSLAEARSRGLHHPNCTHSLSAYRPGITKVGNARSDPEGYEAKQRQRELERRIRDAKLRAEAAITPEARRAANARVRALQRELREHIRRHGLKRLPYREQIGAGNVPRGTRPPGGPVTPVTP